MMSAFTPNIITKRFSRCLRQLRATGKVKSSRQFALAVDYLPQSLGEILKGRRDAPLELLRKAVDVFGFNPHYLFTGDGHMLLGFPEMRSAAIAHVPAALHRKYAQRFADPHFVGDLPRFQFTHVAEQDALRSFELADRSLEPDLLQGEHVIGTLCPPHRYSEDLPSASWLIVVANDRIRAGKLNRLTDDHLILEVSGQTRASMEKNIILDEIAEVWKLQYRTGAIRAFHENLGPDIQYLRDMVQQQALHLNQMQEKIDLLVAHHNK